MGMRELLSNQCHLKNQSWSRWLSWVAVAASLYCLGLALFHDEILPPHGTLFSILLLLLGSYFGGVIISFIRLPPLLGMLLVGLVLRNVGLFEVTEPNIRRALSVTREIALGVILIKAGLGLDPVALKRMSLTVLKLSFIPCFTEAITAAIVSHYIAHLPWLWALLLGFLLAAVSPAVVVPSLLSLKAKGYGEDKGVATLVVAASSIDDIASISMFGIFLAMLFSPDGNLTIQILRGPLELIVGLSTGIIWGIFIAILPQKEYEYAGAMRTCLLGSGGLCAVVGSKYLGFPGAGPLACITSAFVAGLCWGIQGWSNINPASNFFSKAWIVMQPILFGLIGTEVELRSIEFDDIGTGLIVLLICLTVRIIACFLVLFGGGLNLKEMFFISLAWLPKATVQAALSTVALELVKKERILVEEDLKRATMLLTTAVMAILITAPIGSVAISLSAPLLLSKPIPTVENGDP